MRITTGNQKFDTMIEASLNSIRRRQDMHRSGGIVESDLAVYNGFCYGWRPGEPARPVADTVYPRSHLGRVLVRLGMADRLRRALDFFAECQAEDGSFEQLYIIDNPRRIYALKKHADFYETDGTGYVLWHVRQYVRFTNDLTWLAAHRPLVERSARVLLRALDARTGLIWGREEICLAGPDGEVDSPGGSMTQINGTTHRGLLAAAYLAERLGQAALADECRQAAGRLFRGMQQFLWTGDEGGHYVTGVGERDRPFAGPMIFALFPAYSGGWWGDREHRTLSWLWPRLHGRDPMLPDAVWDSDLSHVAAGKPTLNARYSGCGVTVGKHPVWIDLLLRDGREEDADRLLQLTLDLTDETGLIPEHLNTLCLGAELDPAMKLWPDPTARIDRGNLMHLTFFLDLVCTVIGVEPSGGDDAITVSPRLLPCLKHLEVRDLPVSPTASLSFDAVWERGRTRIANIDASACDVPIRSSHPRHGYE